MKAIVHDEYGAPDDILELRDIDPPAPEDSSVLVRVHATSVNPADWHLINRPQLPLGRTARCHPLPGAGPRPRQDRHCAVESSNLHPCHTTRHDPFGIAAGYECRPLVVSDHLSTAPAISSKRCSSAMYAVSVAVNSAIDRLNRAL